MNVIIIQEAAGGWQGKGGHARQSDDGQCREKSRLATGAPNASRHCRCQLESEPRATNYGMSSFQLDLTVFLLNATLMTHFGQEASIY